MNAGMVMGIWAYYRGPVTEHDVGAFADLTGDHHPQHTDAAWAERRRRR